MRIILLLCLCACHSPAVEAPHPDAPIVVDGLSTPESVAHDANADVYLVTNIAGSPFEADGEGFVSRIAPDGTMLELRWIDGLNAPKGIAISGDTIAIADLTAVRRFDRATGAVRDVIPIEGATFLNDVAAGPDGSFFVSDSGMRPAGDGIEPTGTDAIYRIASDATYVAIVRGAELHLPNGLAVHGEDLFMVPFGGSALSRFDLEGHPRGSIELPSGQLDGLVVGDCAVVSSLQAMAVLVGPVEGPFSPAIEEVAAADIGADTTRDRILMPMIMQGQLRIQSLPTCR